jgi:hypothetical protein
MADKFKALLESVTDYTDDMSMITWAARFRRSVANLEVLEDLTNPVLDGGRLHPITNGVVERRCAGSALLRPTLEAYALRGDEQVCLLLVVEGAATNALAKIAATYEFMDMGPGSESLSSWCGRVRNAATKAGLLDKWELCLVKFEMGCSAEQLSALSLKQRDANVKGFDDLFVLCQAIGTMGKSESKAAPADTGSPTPLTPKRGQGGECYNCGRPGHTTQSCPDPLTPTSYKYWKGRSGAPSTIKKKVKEYEAKLAEEKRKKEVAKKRTTGAVAETKCEEECSSDGDFHTASSSEDEYATYLRVRQMLQEKNKVSSKSRAFPSTTVSPKSSLAQRAGTVNGVSSYGVMFDSGCNRSIVSKRLVTGLRRFPCTSHKVQYGNGTEVIRERVLVPVVTEGKKFVVNALVSSQTPFDLLIGEDFMNGRVILDYTTMTISFAATTDREHGLPDIPQFPWGKGKPRAELLHRKSTKAEQDAVLQEELKILDRISDLTLRKIVEKYIHLFHEVNKYGWVPNKWEPYHLEIRDPGDEWVPMKEYPYSKEKADFINYKLAMWRARGFADFSESDFCLPVVCAPKPQPADETMRLAINFQQTNRFTVKSDYKVPSLNETLKKIRGDTFTVLDGEEGYHKVRMDEESRRYNALKANGHVMTCAGLMEGMMNAGNHYQKCVDGMLSEDEGAGPALDKWANAYVDDTIVYSNGMADHYKHVEDILARMFKDNVKPKWRKGQFGVNRATFGGRIITKNGTELVKDKAKVLRNLRRPVKWKEVQSVYGLFLWHKQWIDHFDLKIKPVSRFLAGEWKHRKIPWDRAAEKAYVGLCDDIERSQTRARMGPGVIHIYTDWAKEAVAYHWTREHKGKVFSLGHGGRTMRGAELNWKAPRGELYALAFACKDLKKEIVGKEVVLHTDHIAWSDLKVNTPESSLNSYLMDILEVAPKGVYVKGVLNTVADAITRLMPKRVRAAISDTRTRVPEEFRQEVLREVHESAIGGHFGQKAMIRIIGARYKAWKGLTEQVSKYECAYCDEFKPVKGRYANRSGVIQAYNVSRPWEMVGIDVQTSKDASGNEFHWLYVICFFSKFAEGILMSATSAPEVVRALAASTAWKAGIPAKATGDVDSAFTNSDIFRGFLAEQGVEWVDKDAHHHEGVIERGVQTFKHVLEAKTVEGHKPSVALSRASGAVNKSLVASSTGHTPHSLIYGKEYVSALQRRIELANRNTEKYKERMAKYHNKDRAETLFEVGQKVMIRDHRKYIPRGVPKFTGPFRIIKRKGHSCTLLNKYTGRAYRRNIKDLRHPSTFAKYETNEENPEEYSPREAPKPKVEVRPVQDTTSAKQPTSTLASRFQSRAGHKAPSSPIGRRTRSRATRNDDLVGKRVRVRWGDGNWYSGEVVKACDSEHGSHEIKYDPDHTGDNKEPIYENLTNNPEAVRADTPSPTWEVLD